MSDIYDRIQTELVTSGKYKEIYNLLESELKNSGWYDNFVHMTTSKMENLNDKDLQYNKVLELMKNDGLNSVPEEIKVKVVQKIAEFLENVVE